jgi:dTDP-4-amino-4,6-dideoxygalactose transaminase
MIPLLDLVAQYNTIKPEIDNAIQEVLQSGKFILGPQEKAFETEVASYLGVKHAIGLASGTDALIIALRAGEIGKGDEVIVPAFSFFATAGAVLTVGATPVFVDVDPATYLINIEQVKSAITPKTKAIIPVHLYGQPVDMDELMALAKTNNLLVLEDNAQAFGAEYKGKKTGSIGDMGCLSFFPSKNLGAYGDAGMVTTNDDTLAEKMRMLRVHGWKKKYFPEMLGYNSRLDELQAAILRVKLHHLDAWNDKRRDYAHEYTAKLAEFGVKGPIEKNDRKHVYHLYMLRLINRDVVREGLQAAGIATDVYYPQPLHLTKPCLSLGWQPGSFPVSERASTELMAIPLYPELDQNQRQEIMTNLKKLIADL